MTVSKATRKSVQKRADDCCEYSRLALLSGIVPFHIDHVIPIKHDGSDNSDNLCFACYHCNAHKGHDLTGFDPLSGNITPLYNPRKQVWSEHFENDSEMRIIGLSPEGRTTVRVLQMNTDDRVEMRQVLAEIGEYPC